MPDSFHVKYDFDTAKNGARSTAHNRKLQRPSAPRRSSPYSSPPSIGRTLKEPEHTLEGPKQGKPVSPGSAVRSESRTYAMPRRSAKRRTSNWSDEYDLQPETLHFFASRICETKKGRLNKKPTL